MTEKARERMVRYQLHYRGIDDPRVLEAFEAVPREDFVADEYREMAYRDGPIPIERGQTMSQPYVVALMTEALDVEAGDTILEIGTGSGYQAAILAELGARVFSVERHDALADRARENLEQCGYGDVTVITGDGSTGLAEHAPYDGMLVTAASPSVPTPLLEQLREGRHLVIPVEESRRHQKLIRITNDGEGRYSRKELGDVAFVPLIGKEGYDDKRRRRSGLWMSR